MTEALEGTQIPINSATKAQLRAFCAVLGVTATNFDSEAKLIERIRAAGYDEPHIVVPEGAAPAAAKKVAVAKGAMEEPMVELTVHVQEGPGGKRPVFVGVNGVALLIPRNQRSKVKLRYYEALKNAIETKYEYDEEAKANLPRELPSYPYQVWSMPSQAQIDAWYAFLAKEEAKLRRAEPIDPADDEEEAA